VLNTFRKAVEMNVSTREGRVTFGRDVFPVLRPTMLVEAKLRRITAASQMQTRDDLRSKGEIGRIRATVLSVGNVHLHGELYGDFLRSRKQVFIDTKLWDLPQSEGMEFDQYDTPQCRSIVLHEYGEVIAGIRILPTKARCGCYSYMLRDAQLGIIDTIPQHVLYEEAPIADNIWEATRLFISPEVPAKRRILVQSRLMQEMAAAAATQGATYVVGIVPYVFRRWLERLGMGALPIGPKFTIGEDISQAAMIDVDTVGTSWDQNLTKY
jgi:acyl homoserine lactone synthase